MKLPGIDYGRGVRPLGKLDPGLPVAVGRAQAGVAKQAAGLATQIGDIIEANEVAADAADYRIQMSELNADIKSRKTYTTEELEELGIEYEPKTVNGIELEEYPAHEFNEKVYEAKSRAIYDEHSANASRKGRSILSKMRGQLEGAGAAEVAEISNKAAIDHSRARMDMGFEGAIRAGNEEAAEMVANVAVESGIWSQEEFASKMINMPGRIAAANYEKVLDKFDDPQALDEAQGILLDDTRIGSEKKTELYSRYQSKINQQNKELERKKDEAQKAKSFMSYVDTSVNIAEGGPISWESIKNMAPGMEETHWKGLYTLNKAAAEGGGTTDDTVANKVMTRIAAISLPGQGTIHDRRREATYELFRAMGLDPVTMETIGPARISAKDFRTMFNTINEAQGFAYSSPDVKNMGDTIWRTLTGGSKDMMTSLFGTGPDTLNAIEAENAMLQASVETGPGFDPQQWWEKNQGRYLTTAIDDNMKTLQENRFDRYIVTDYDKPGYIDSDATAQQLRDKVTAGELSDIEAKAIMNEIYRLRQLNIQNADRLKRQREE